MNVVPIVEEVVGQFRAARLPLTLSLLTRVVLWRLDPGGAGLWRGLVEQQIRKVVREGLNDQPAGLAAFPTVQGAYVIKRGAGAESVPLEEMTSAEIARKADEYDALAQSVQRHADELRCLVQMLK